MGMPERIKLIRNGTGLSQEKFGEKLGITKMGVQAWEYGRNNPSKAMIHKISEVYGINEEWILNGKNLMIDPDDELLDKYRIGNDPAFRIMLKKIFTNKKLLKNLKNKLIK